MHNRGCYPAFPALPSEPLCSFQRCNTKYFICPFLFELQSHSETTSSPHAAPLFLLHLSACAAVTHAGRQNFPCEPLMTNTAVRALPLLLLLLFLLLYFFLTSAPRHLLSCFHSSYAPTQTDSDKPRTNGRTKVNSFPENAFSFKSSKYLTACGELRRFKFFKSGKQRNVSEIPPFIK